MDKIMETLAMYHLHEGGKSYCEIGRIYGYSKQAVHQRITKLFGKKITTEQYIAMKCGKVIEYKPSGTYDTALSTSCKP